MIINLDNIYTYNSLLNKSLHIAKLYPQLIKVTHIGTSNDNRIIFMVKVGKGNRGPVFVAGVHGREIINPTVMLSLIERLSHRYYSYGEKLLDKYALYFIPLLNPDGYTIAMEGYYAINDKILRNNCRRCNIPYKEYKFNGDGVDINRNFMSQSFAFTNNSGLPDNEPETMAFIKVCEQNDFMGMIDFHSRGNSIFYYRSAMVYEYNRKQFDIACRLSKITGYSLYTPNDENSDNLSGGNTVNFFSERYLLPAITVETVEDEATFPLEASYCMRVHNELKNVPLEFLRMLIYLH